MKTPLTYYGGKQQLAATILKLIPEHEIYVEPFIGGAAIYFAKEPSRCEVINDTNGELINFYEVMKRDFPALQSEIQIGLHSRKQHHNADVVYKNPDMFDRVKRAWAVWMLANTSYLPPVLRFCFVVVITHCVIILGVVFAVFSRSVSRRVQSAAPYGGL
jgi:DNA adenine methylase